MVDTKPSSSPLDHDTVPVFTFLRRGQVPGYFSLNTDNNREELTTLRISLARAGVLSTCPRVSNSACLPVPEYIGVMPL